MASVKCASGVASSQFLLMLYASTPVAFAQELSSEPSEQIIVTGQRLLLGAQPDRVVSEDEIASYGLNSVTELVDEIARERGASTDDVIYLIDGQRVVGLGDIASYPTEAIDKIELLPRGTAAQIGGSASKQVVNIAPEAKGPHNRWPCLACPCDRRRLYIAYRGRQLNGHSATATNKPCITLAARRCASGK